MESVLRSNDIFVNKILDRISAVKSHNYAIDQRGAMVETSRNLYGTTTQRGATVAAARLAMEFPHLRKPARIAIESQLKVAASDPVWKDDEAYLRRLLDELNKLPD